jgi:hypothetical protein
MADGTVCAVPVWMTEAGACARLSWGSPEVSLRSLVELRALLDIRQAEAGAEETCRGGSDSPVGPSIFSAHKS